MYIIYFDVSLIGARFLFHKASKYHLSRFLSDDLSRNAQKQGLSGCKKLCLLTKRVFFQQNMQISRVNSCFQRIDHSTFGMNKHLRL